VNLVEKKLYSRQLLIVASRLISKSIKNACSDMVEDIGDGRVPENDNNLAVAGKFFRWCDMCLETHGSFSGI
jgi:hypothetical protein